MRYLPPRLHALDTRRVKSTVLAPRPPKVRAEFYGSVEWRKLIVEIIRRRGRRCEQCGRRHDERGKAIRVFGDHIIEIKDGGALLDPANIRLLCGSCHTAKTIAIKKRRIPGGDL